LVKLNSIRWRLPISYAAIALLAAVSLGTVLLLTLRSYYTQRERDYMQGNAEAIGSALTPLIQGNVPAQVIQSQLDNFAFLSQVRVALVDPNGHTLVTSTAPGAFDVSVVAVPIGSVATLPWDGVEQGPISYWSFIAIRQVKHDAAQPWQSFDERRQVGGRDSVFLKPLTVAGTLYGFDLTTGGAAGTQRSRQVVRQALADASGRLLGYVQLSDGPAYGREVVGRVAVAWAIAGAIAVVLAAAAGAVVSRSIGGPIVGLAGTTQRMAAGDLTARADAGPHPLTELGLLASSYNDMAGQMEQTIEALRRFVSDAAHELQTPLTALRTNLELAADECDATSSSAAGSRVFLERAQAQAVRLEKLAAGLLDLSRLETGATPDLVPVNLTALVEQASEAYASQADQAGLAFVLELPEGGAPLPVLADETQLRRAIDNLVDNACKFTPEGGTVRVELQAVAGGETHGGSPSRARRWAEVSVEDTGIGIPADEVAHLFGRFHRARNAAAYPGNGLGLAIVKAVAECHGGEVVGENTGQGARFRIRLPLAADG
jgi:signal transduction histidine kinase